MKVDREAIKKIKESHRNLENEKDVIKAIAAFVEAIEIQAVSKKK